MKIIIIAKAVSKNKKSQYLFRFTGVYAGNHVKKILMTYLSEIRLDLYYLVKARALRVENNILYCEIVNIQSIDQLKKRY